MFAVINPPSYTTPSGSKLGHVDPESGPLDLTKHTLVLLHAGAFSSAGFTPQVRAFSSLPSISCWGGYGARVTVKEGHPPSLADVPTLRAVVFRPTAGWGL